MGLRGKILLPVMLCGAVALGLLVWAGVRATAAAPAVAGLIGAAAAAVVLLLAVVALLIERRVCRPLARLECASRAPSASAAADAPAADEAFGRVGAGVRSLHEQVVRQHAELRALGERLERAESALRLGEERFALSLRGADDGLWERDLDNGRILLSARWKSLLGYAEDEFPDRLDAWRSHVHPDDLAALEAALAAHVQGASPRYERQLRLLHKDGRYRWVLSRASAVRHANGRAYRVVGLDTDVTAIKRVEHILEQVVEGTAGAYGEDFFRALVRHFAAALEVSCAFITECADQPPSRVRTLAFWSASGFADNFEYDLHGTPCEAVIKERRSCLHPAGVASAFPVEEGFQSYLGIPILGRDGTVLGHLAFLDQNRMSSEILVESVFRIFAARAAAELERKAMLARLTQTSAPT